MSDAANLGPIASASSPVRGSAAAFLFTASVLLSSALLFLIEPMIARAMLPEFGGSPSVWNTCVVGFQCLLLAGYAWAHISSRIGGARAQIAVHLLVVGGSLALVPFSLPEVHRQVDSPALSVLFTLLATIALPFTLLASNSALAQRWFTAVSNRDPYPLYAASNAGSLVALLGYPLAFEPLFGLTRGWRIWAAGYIGFAALTLFCAVRAWPHRPESSAAPSARRAEPASWRARGGWMLRAAVGSSLLLSATMKMTTDVASAPMLWVLPLALYLLTFVIAFSRLRVQRAPVAVLTALGIGWSLTVLIYTFAMPAWVGIAALSLTVFSGSLLCHLDLAATRPAPALLTEFYFWIALGGALGGVLNTLIAPLLLASVAEFPITLFLLAVLIHAKGGYGSKFPPERMRRAATWLPPLFAMALLAAAALALASWRGGEGWPLAPLIWRVVPLALILQGLLLGRHAGQFETIVALLTLVLLSGGFSSSALVAEERSFFGTLRVMDAPGERIVVHGTTVHGAQRREPALRHQPTRYYHPAGPFGREVLQGRPPANIAIVGLGAGSLAAMGRPGDRITFFEIDPMVEAIAREHFTFLGDDRTTVNVKIGDGRLLLAKERDRAFDVIIVDAFSSDAIPTHLLTREALSLYLRKVRADGVVLIHISNQHLDLTRVFRGWSAAEKRRVAILGYRPDGRAAAEGAAPTLAVALAPRQQTLESLVRGRWTWLGDGRSVVWSDDRTDVVAVIGRIRF